ncbi:MAG: Amino acid transporter fused to UspA-like domain [Candidatus Methanohalarchaeum thermophilum]|uniref:Amino acid transporter fused to UspA-like domain n=1 Tax=Methanohalarchaeum thermophilum TaxID=1903181 RepID=A0A1Q6DSB1_METT1|nr:MAG: Amino acid transporter fused to UspA-like domain [Candidatus Methanohalarchaeum thermophilum]
MRFFSGSVGGNIEGEKPESSFKEDKGHSTIVEEDIELERTIGLAGAFTVGIGTMIGAGIFVFPGIAVGYAGPAAAISFVIGGLIALIVALPTSELATAMPRSGGGYYFISRGMGSFFGSMVGISLWIGLIFASSFYLMGFGFYGKEVLVDLGVRLSVDPIVIAILFGLILILVSIFGTENSAKLQNLVVLILLGTLAVFLGYGSLDSFVFLGGNRVSEDFFSSGFFPIFSTAALVFTSYLGFAQVATIAGDIKKPGKNLPLAMIVSVLVVTTLYVLTIFVSTSVFNSADLFLFGETAIIEVSKAVLGPLGGVVILFAGLLATFSSANASILASSRALYSVSRDAILPKKLSKINLKYGTPHIALILATPLIVGLILFGRVEILAEVASFLHLVMYGLMCFALVFLRRMNPSWYNPKFTVPLYPYLPILGGLLSFSLIFFMELLTKLIGVTILILSISWYITYAKDIELKGVE